MYLLSLVPRCLRPTHLLERRDDLLAVELREERERLDERRLALQSGADVSDRVLVPGLPDAFELSVVARCTNTSARTDTGSAPTHRYKHRVTQLSHTLCHSASHSAKQLLLQRNRVPRHGTTINSALHTHTHRHTFICTCDDVNVLCMRALSSAVTSSHASAASNDDLLASKRARSSS